MKNHERKFVALALSSEIQEVVRFAKMSKN